MRLANSAGLPPALGGGCTGVAGECIDERLFELVERCRPNDELADAQNAADEAMKLNPPDPVRRWRTMHKA